MREHGSVCVLVRKPRSIADSVASPGRPSGESRNGREPHCGPAGRNHSTETETNAGTDAHTGTELDIDTDIDITIDIDNDFNTDTNIDNTDTVTVIVPETKLRGTFLSNRRYTSSRLSIEITQKHKRYETPEKNS